MELDEATTIAVVTLRGVVKNAEAGTKPELMTMLTQAADTLEAMLQKAKMLDLIGRKAAATGITEADAERMMNLVLNDDPSMSGIKGAAAVYEKRMVAAGLDPVAYASRLSAMTDAGNAEGAQAIFAEIREKIAAHEKGGKSE